jgi:lipoate-protein ligase A
LLVHEAMDGFTNMATDEAIMQANVVGDCPPTLRLYRWRPACVSLGYFQSVTDVDIDACRGLGIDCVRRPTGGRAVLHDAELTYSVVARADDVRVSGTVLESYRKISSAILEGLRVLGVHADMKPMRQPASPIAHPLGLPPLGKVATAPTAACFDVPSDYEITAAGRKLVGSAQVRRAGVLLQHGSILMDAHAGQTFSVLRPPESSNQYEVTEWLVARITSLDELLGRRVTFDEVAEAVVEGFTRNFGSRFVPGTLTLAEQHLVDRLLEDKYRTDAWNLKPADRSDGSCQPHGEEKR